MLKEVGHDEEGWTATGHHISDAEAIARARVLDRRCVHRTRIVALWNPAADSSLDSNVAVHQRTFATVNKPLSRLSHREGTMATLSKQTPTDF
jgi:hypothetical protein